MDVNKKFLLSNFKNHFYEASISKFNDLSKKLLLSKLKKEYYDISYVELNDIIEKYDFLMLYLFETGCIDRNTFDTRWNFIYNPLKIIYISDDTFNYTIFELIYELTKNNLYYLFPLHHYLENIKLKSDVLKEMQIVLNRYYDDGIEFVKSRYIRNNYYILDSFIEDEDDYYDLMKLRYVSNDYKKIITSFKKINDKWNEIEEHYDYFPFSWYLDILYIYIVIERKVDNLDEVMTVLDYIYNNIDVCVDKLRFYSYDDEDEMDAYLIIQKIYSDICNPRKYIK